MRIRVADLPADGLTVEERIDPGRLRNLVALEENAGCDFKGPLTVNLRVTPSAGLVEVEGRLAGMVAMACVRCLTPTHRPLESSFRLAFTRTIPGEATEEPPQDRELRAEELGLILFEGEDIDLRDAIQDQVILAIPMQPVCRQDCRGLCPRCGADLNEGPCGCSRDEVDPRLAILKTLKLDS